MNVLNGCVAVAIVSLLAGLPGRLTAGENAPEDKLFGTLDATIRILDPVPLTDLLHAKNKAPLHKINVGDKVIIQVTYDPTALPVKSADVRFASRRMAAIEIAKIPQKPTKENDKPTACLAVVVRATAEKSCIVGVECQMQDGSSKTVFFSFEIAAKK